MKSLQILPLSERLPRGHFNRVFNKKNFSILLSLLKQYHYALKEAELEIYRNEYNQAPQLKKYIYETKFNDEKRFPFETNSYSGISKFDYFHFKTQIVNYHKALLLAEKRLKQHEATKELLSQHKQLLKDISKKGIQAIEKHLKKYGKQ